MSSRYLKSAQNRAEVWTTFTTAISLWELKFLGRDEKEDLLSETSSTCLQLSWPIGRYCTGFLKLPKKKKKGFVTKNNFFMENFSWGALQLLYLQNFSAYLAVSDNCLAFTILMTYVAGSEIFISLQNSSEFILVIKKKEYCHLSFLLLYLYFPFLILLCSMEGLGQNAVVGIPSAPVTRKLSQ